MAVFIIIILVYWSECNLPLMGWSLDRFGQCLNQLSGPSWESSICRRIDRVTIPSENGMLVPLSLTPRITTGDRDYALVASPLRPNHTLESLYMLSIAWLVPLGSAPPPQPISYV